MDALLRYILYHIAFTLLTLEIVLMVSCCLAIIIIKLITKWSMNRRKLIQEQISSIIQTALLNEQPLESIIIPDKFCQFRNLVEVLEKFDQRFNDKRWTDIKEFIVSTYLGSKIENYTSSFSWFKRQLAARACLLCPHKAEENILKKLLDDSRYLVRVTAAVCITQTDYRHLFYEVLQKMSHETALSQFPYRDALMQINQEKYQWLELLLKEETDPAIVAICLDILTTRYTRNMLDIVKPFVNVENRVCRTLAIKALGNIPSSESIQLLKSHLIDSDWEIRAECLIGLQKLYAIQTIPEIRYLLNDPVWWVRLQAALALKNFGKQGIDVLNSQEVNQEPLAHEIAQYTLALP